MRYKVRVELIEVVSDQSGITENIMDAVEATYDSREVAERVFALAEGRK